MMMMVVVVVCLAGWLAGWLAIAAVHLLVPVRVCGYCLLGLLTRLVAVP
jgi:hypothetical protein